MVSHLQYLVLIIYARSPTFGTVSNSTGVPLRASEVIDSKYYYVISKIVKSSETGMSFPMCGAFLTSVFIVSFRKILWYLSVIELYYLSPDVASLSTHACSTNKSLPFLVYVWAGFYEFYFLLLCTTIDAELCKRSVLCVTHCSRHPSLPKSSMFQKWRNLGSIFQSWWLDLWLEFLALFDRKNWKMSIIKRICALCDKS